MQKRESWIWFGILLFAGFMALSFVVVPPQLPSPFAPDIIGSMIGFMLAISFAELVKIDEKNNRAKKIEADILEEIQEIATAIEGGALHAYVSMDIWELAIATGDLALLDPDRRNVFVTFYKGARTYNWVVDAQTKLLAQMAEGPELLKQLEKNEQEVRTILMKMADSLGNK